MQDEHQLDDLMASFHRCRRNSDFIDSFYAIFTAKSPEIAQRFANTDFSIQKLMLRESLLEMLLFYQGVAGSREEVENLGRRHKKLDISEEMYWIWLDSLCEAVGKHDPMAGPELEDLWRRAMRQGINVMLSVD